MDYSGFWGVLILQTIVYGFIWFQTTAANVHTLQKIFLAISLPVGAGLLYMFFTLDPSKSNYPMPSFGVHAIGVIAPIALVVALFKRSIDGYLNDAKAEEAESVRYAALTQDERRAKEAEASRLKRQAAEHQAVSFYGKVVPKLKCPHCGETGQVHRKDATRVDKTRVNSIAGRAVGMGTNTERHVTQLRCDACEMKWDV
jgi:hypothetical protein